MRASIPVLAVVLTCALVVACCVAPHDEQPQATPIPPAELLSLPTNAQIDCYDDPSLNQGSAVVWELPGVDPSDPNSAYMGDRGERLGSVRACTVVSVTDYAWSETDQVFWVRIKAEDLEGWIRLDIVDFVP